jgi:hypothetical protein
MIYDTASLIGSLSWARTSDSLINILLMPQKCEAFLNTYKNINKGEKLDALRHKAIVKSQ